MRKILLVFLIGLLFGMIPGILIYIDNYRYEMTSASKEAEERDSPPTMSTSFQSSPEKRPTGPKLTLIRDPAAFTLATHSAGLTESEAQAMLDRSRLFPDAVAVKAAFRDMTPANIFAALEAEAEFVRTIQEARDSGPAPTAPWDVRYTHHHAIVVPKAFTAWTPLLNRLSELRVPPQLIEAFRQTEVEGLTR